MTLSEPPGVRKPEEQSSATLGHTQHIYGVCSMGRLEPCLSVTGRLFLVPVHFSYVTFHSINDRYIFYVLFMFVVCLFAWQHNNTTTSIWSSYLLHRTSRCRIQRHRSHLNLATLLVSGDTSHVTSDSNNGYLESRSLVFVRVNTQHKPRVLNMKFVYLASGSLDQPVIIPCKYRVCAAVPAIADGL